MGAGAINGTGSTPLNNTLLGNEGANVLDGPGTGNDTMTGGKGSDRSYVKTAAM